MRKISIINWKGNKYEGDWNEKFYPSNIDKHPELFRIYINNNPYHITEKEKEKLLKETASSKIEQDNARIGLIKREFEKLDKEAQNAILTYLNMEYT